MWDIFTKLQSFDISWVNHFLHLAVNPAERSKTHVYEFLMIIPVFLLLTLVRLLCEMAFYRLGYHILEYNRPNFARDSPKESEQKMIKFREQAFKLCFHGVLAVLAVYFFREEYWWNKPYYTFTTYGNDMVHGFTHKFFYMLQTAFHLHSLLFHYWERRNHVRDDDLQMQIHHFVTIILLVGSYHLGHIRIGTLVLYVHDCSDVSTSMAKMANYTKASEKVLGFFLFQLIIFWAYYRLYRFPVDVILLALENYGFPNQGMLLIFLIFLVMILLLLHWIWFYQILHIPMALVRGMREYDPTENWKDATMVKASTSEPNVDDVSPTSSDNATFDPLNSSIAHESDRLNASLNTSTTSLSSVKRDPRSLNSSDALESATDALNASLNSSKLRADEPTLRSGPVTRSSSKHI